LFPQKCNTDPDEYNYHMMMWYLFSAMMHGTAAIQHKGMGRVHVAPKRERERESLQSRDPGMGDWEMDADNGRRASHSYTHIHTTVLARESLHTPAFTTVPLPDLRGIPGAPSIERESLDTLCILPLLRHTSVAYISTVALSIQFSHGWR
jgi:hypothetical protein